MKNYLAAFAILLTLSGCGQKALEKFNPSKKEVTLEVQKSVGNKQDYTAEANKNLAEAMTAASIPYKTQDRGGQEVIVEMSGVIATMSKSWNLYINDEAQNFSKLSDITIKPGDKISWQYQAITQ